MAYGGGLDGNASALAGCKENSQRARGDSPVAPVGTEQQRPPATGREPGYTARHASALLRPRSRAGGLRQADDRRAEGERRPELPDGERDRLGQDASVHHGRERALL